MASIQFYANEEDARQLLTWLNERPDVSFLVPQGKDCWRASLSYLDFSPTPICLWHIPSGSLPLYLEGFREPAKMIDDPFSGWCGKAASNMPSFPFFGTFAPGIFHWHLTLVSKYSWSGFHVVGPNIDNAMGQSSVGWIGDKQKSIGRVVPAQTKRFWANLRAFIRRNASPINPIDSSEYPLSYYAFPGALREIQAGRPCGVGTEF